MASEVIYLGHCISREGVKPVPEKVTAITEAPYPENVTQLKSYLGMLNYYHRYLSDISSELAPLHLLLKKGQPWKWEAAQIKAFQKSKDMLKSAKLLVHYDSTKELILSCDASPYGIGAVLSHVFEDGSERPIAYASRTLADAEKNYAQVDKEGLSVIFGVKKFHQYLYGKTFVIYTDHKPLVGLFRENRAVPQMAADRVRRWALTLATYSYKIKYRAGKDHSNADGLSRLPVPEKPSKIPKAGHNVLLLDHMNSTPISVNNIRSWTRCDPILSKVISFVMSGNWPVSPVEDMKPYIRRKSELSVEENCLLWGCRVVIPPQGREMVLQELHVGHPGMSKMKSLARSYLWWPKLDEAIETVARNCVGCQQIQKNPGLAPLHPWEYPKSPWARIHIDYAGPFMDKMFFVVVDATTKWPEVLITKSTSAEKTVSMLRSLFARFGIPSQIVSDNGPQFRSEEFSIFVRNNGIRHIFSAPYHPATNGAAERLVQSFKSALKASKHEKASIQTKLDQFLSKYRISPQATTGESLAKLMFGRNVRTRLDLLRPELQQKVAQKQQVQTQRGGKMREFVQGQTVQCRDYRSGQAKWMPGMIVSRTGPVSYVVKTEIGESWRRHIDQICSFLDNRAQDYGSPTYPSSQSVSAKRTENGNETRSQDVLAEVTETVTPNIPTVQNSENTDMNSSQQVLIDTQPDSAKTDKALKSDKQPTRRSQREIRKPKRYIYE